MGLMFCRSGIAVKWKIKKYIHCSNIKTFLVTFARKDNSLRINRLVGLLENWVTRWQPFVFLSSSLLCSYVITLDTAKVIELFDTSNVVP